MRLTHPCIFVVRHQILNDNTIRLPGRQKKPYFTERRKRGRFLTLTETV